MDDPRVEFEEDWVTVVVIIGDGDPTLQLDNSEDEIPKQIKT